MKNGEALAGRAWARARSTRRAWADPPISGRREGGSRASRRSRAEKLLKKAYRPYRNPGKCGHAVRALCDRAHACEAWAISPRTACPNDGQLRLGPGRVRPSVQPLATPPDPTVGPPISSPLVPGGSGKSRSPAGRCREGRGSARARAADAEKS